MVNLKYFYSFIYYFITIIYLETVFKIFTNIKVSFSNIIFIILFSITTSSILYILSSIFNKKINKIITAVNLFMLSTIFTSQYIYYKIFNTFYTLYSAKNGSQVIEFWKDILLLVAKYIHIILIFFLPFIIFIFISNKLISQSKLKLRKIPLLIFLASTPYIIFFILINYTKENLFKKIIESSSPIYTVQNIGLLSTIKLDFYNILFKDNVQSKALETFNTHEKNIIQSKNKVKVNDYNVLNINFDKLIAEEENKIIKELHSYFKNIKPTQKNDYTGKFKGYNLILITAESLYPYAINKNLTPTLYKLVNEGYKFTNFYNPIWGVSTTDGEYVACTGLIPKSGVWSFKESSKNYLPFVMGNQFKKLGYKTLAFHNHTYTYYKRNLSHPNMGYDYKAVGNGLNVKKNLA
ncbi:sulfatase-like hydrolase/transferase [Thermobrachium celere]|uniref:sulfatase-like hydrolase/transferase n=1 Tax=Thermobrachium celere TaxID=53422 RepID=UPI001943B717|nr:sulfatase-like hydrolase/transferase [Thermobrachium celere]GFR36700.1 hypothetical protein TCEA9_25120 [Thermobrachium celere]